jgi:thioesterase domain-containing protein/acyl carrier protein
VLRHLVPAAPKPARAKPKRLLDLVRSEVAAVLGHDSPTAIDADSAFGDLGFDSLSGIELRNRLHAATGVRLPPTVVFDFPTVAALTERLTADRQEPSGSPLATLYRKVCESGHPVEAMHLLVTASWSAPTFTGAGPAPAPATLADGPGLPIAVCFPSLAPRPDQEYARLAAGLDRPVHVLPHAGYASGQAVPDSLDALLATHVDSVQRLVQDQPFVLIGRSTGGAVAHAVADRLAARGRPAAGLVLIDTYDMDEEAIGLDWLVGLPARDAIRLGAGFDAATDDTALLAMGAYIRLFLDWRPTPLPHPVLHVRPDTPVAGMPADGWRSDWPIPHEQAEVPGDHFTMLEQHADRTAKVIRAWLDSVQ